MTCSFCMTGESSQNGRAGVVLNPDAVGDRIVKSAPLLRSVTILGGEPAIHLDGALEIAARVPQNLNLVWKTNATASRSGLRLLRGVPDVVLADYKFGNDTCALRIAGIDRYGDIVKSNLRWSARNSRLFIRHLLMPGHFDCCFTPVMDWIGKEMPEIPLSLMTGFLPTFRATNDPVLGRTLRTEEWTRAEQYVRLKGLRTIQWVLAPQDNLVPVRDDKIWIDGAGRICVDSGSAALISALKRLIPEFVVVP